MCKKGWSVATQTGPWNAIWCLQDGGRPAAQAGDRRGGVIAHFSVSLSLGHYGGNYTWGILSVFLLIDADEPVCSV